MIVLYILGGLLALLILYVLFLGVCALLVSPDKTYEKNSLFYRFLLESATAVAIKPLRIRIHVSGMEKISKRTPFQHTDVYLDVLEVFPTQGVKETKTEMIGTAVRHLIATNTEKRDAIWPKDM